MARVDVTLDNILEMSDEDFLESTQNITHEQDSVEHSGGEVQSDNTTVETPDNKSVETDGGVQQNNHEDEDEDEDEEGKKEAGVTTPASPKSGLDPNGSAPKDAKAEGKPEDKAKPADTTGDTPVDYKSFYEKAMVSFKANGKTIKDLKPEEAIQLMQMGANYTRKMQEIQPVRKVAEMLKKNGLLDEARVAYLIDLEKGDPKAVQKLMKDRGLDPLDLNPEEGASYAPSVKHRISDEELDFKTTVDEIVQQKGGLDTVKALRTYDEQSLSMLMKNPKHVMDLHKLRESGVYDQIIGEMERMSMLGQLNASTPFLQRFQTAADTLLKRVQPTVQTNDPASATTTLAGQPEVLATRVEQVKQTHVGNGDRAKAAAITRQSPKSTETAATAMDKLASMSDDDFLKQMVGRV